MMRMIATWLFGIFMAFIILWSGPVLAETIYVNGAAAAGGDGTSWASAYTTIGAALNEAENGDQIWVAGGVYPEALVITSDHNNVSLYGGFSGLETSLDQRDYITNSTTLDGSQADGGSPADHVVSLETVTEFILDGFTITGGRADAEMHNYPENCGGGILAYVIDNTNLIANCIIQGNSADLQGGGISLFCSSPTLHNCTIQGNSALLGGGFWSGECTSRITNCTIRGNSVVGTPGYPAYGGGIYCDYTNATLDNCTISDNSAENEGGGLYLMNSHPTLNNCTISGNSAIDASGGIELSYSNMTLNNCIISGNSGGNSGGGLLVYDSSPILKNCTITGNSARYGGGLWLYEEGSAAPTLVNCIFANNADYAIFFYSGTPTITYNLFFNNNLGHSGNPVDSATLNLDTGTNLLDIDPAFLMFGPGALTGTWTAVSAYDPDSNTTTLTDDQAAFAPGTLAGRHINPKTDQGLQTLIIDNGEKNVTVSGDWSQVGNATYLVADYHLRHNSGALDQGDNSSAPPTDMDGDDRPWNSIVDIGADEYNPATTDSDNDGTPDLSDNCPDDPNKTEPGKCGCGVAETWVGGGGSGCFIQSLCE